MLLQIFPGLEQISNEAAKAADKLEKHKKYIEQQANKSMQHNAKLKGH